MASATESKKTTRVRMLQMQAGYEPVEVENPDGTISVIPGAMYTREVREEYEIESAEASRLIKAGYAVAVSKDEKASKTA